MKKSIAIVLFVAFASIVGVRLYEELSSVSATNESAALTQRAVMLVDMAAVEPHLFESRLEVLGELRPHASVDVMSRISGRLREVLVERGDVVRKGQLLAVVDDLELGQQIRRQEAAILVTKAAANREQATSENLEIQARRTRQLHEEQLVPTQALEQIDSQLRAAEAQLQLARATVQQAEATLSELKIQQEQTRVYSPLDGFAVIRYLDPGALVSASVAIVNVVDISRVKTVIPTPERQLKRVTVGLSARVVVDAFADQEYQGVVTRISPVLNPDTRSADVEIEIANPGQVLKPGMFARVSVESRTERPSLAIPRAALLTRGDDKGVFLLTEDLTTQYRSIKIGRIQGDFVEVLEGLELGTEVVTSGAQKLNEGDKVRIG